MFTKHDLNTCFIGLQKFYLNKIKYTLKLYLSRAH